MNTRRLHEDIYDHSSRAKARMRQIETLSEAEENGSISTEEALKMSREILKQAAAEADQSVRAIDTLRNTGELHDPEHRQEDPPGEGNEQQNDPPVFGN